MNILDALEAALKDQKLEPKDQVRAAIARKIAAAMDDETFPKYQLDRMSRELLELVAKITDEWYE